MSLSKPENKKIFNVLFYIPEFPVNSQNFIESEISHLQKQGKMNITVLSHRKADGYLSENLTGRIIYKKLGFLDLFTILFSFIESFRGFISGLRLYRDIDLPDLQKIFMYVKALGYAYYVKRLKPDHFHIHFLSYPSTMGMIISIITGVPFSISGHARDVFVDGQNINFKAKYARFIRICNVNALDECKKLTDEENRSKIILQYHGVDFDEKKSLVTNRLKKPDSHLIFNVGRYVDKKGQIYLLQAAKILKEKGISFYLKIAGGGPLYTDFFDFINNNNLTEEIELLGDKDKNTPYPDVMEYFSISDLFVLPSIESSSGDVDGIPNTIFEAAVFELPVISTDAGSIGEVVIHEKTGLVAKQKSAEDLAEKIEFVIHNPEKARELAGNLNQYTLNTFGVKKCIKQFEEVLLESLNKV